MCGICGYISSNRIPDEYLIQMRDEMVHRGPDDAGIYTINSGQMNIGLAHRRLSILDLSEKGHQPMISSNGNIVVVFNGEIYNYRELRQKIDGYQFVSDSDTEIIIAAYERWGEDFVNYCNGMFAIALFDLSQSTLFLYRDRMGQKPLYYYYSKNEFVFGSELKTIMRYPGISLELNRNILARYLVKQCIVSPDTIFSNTYKIEPGSAIKVEIKNNELRLTHKRYWSLTEKYMILNKSFNRGYNEAKKELVKKLEKSINYRLVADVPVGILLSGGYDSSVITAIAQRNRKDRIKTFSIGIQGSPLDEAKYAKSIADYIGTDHHELYISRDDMIDTIRQIPKYYDEPFADSSQIATMLVSRMAKQEVSVVLTGDGGDELFAGYPIYYDARIAQLLDPIGRVVDTVLSDNRKMYQKLPHSVRMIAQNSDMRTKTQFNYLAKQEVVSRILPNVSKDYIANYDETGIPTNNWRIKRMLLDSLTYLPDDLHCKVDRASMMFSLEARSPFMDVDVVELALSMPMNYKLKGKTGKRIIKEIAWDMIPKDLLDRPKTGFEVPIDDWMRNELREDIIENSRESFLRKQGLFDPKETQRIIDQYLNSEVNKKRGQKINTVIWSFYMFQKWYEEYNNWIKD